LFFTSAVARRIFQVVLWAHGATGPAAGWTEFKIAKAERRR